MININFTFMMYMMIQCGVFGLLVGLASEDVKRFRHAAFLWILSFFWPVILAWKVLCKSETRND